MQVRGAVLAMAACAMLGCTALAGLDGDYSIAPAGGVGSGAGGASASSGMTTSSATAAGGAGGVGQGGGATSSAATGGAGGATGSWQVIDTLTVDCETANAVQSSAPLEMGETYHLRASGSCIVTTGSTECDAEWMDFNGPHTLDNSNTVDMGIGIDDLTADNNKDPDWGQYNPNHEYTVDFVGKGAPIQANFHDPDNSNNNGSLTLEILRFQ